MIYGGMGRKQNFYYVFNLKKTQKLTSAFLCLGVRGTCAYCGSHTLRRGNGSLKTHNGTSFKRLAALSILLAIGWIKIRVSCLHQANSQLA